MATDLSVTAVVSVKATKNWNGLDRFGLRIVGECTDDVTVSMATTSPRRKRQVRCDVWRAATDARTSLCSGRTRTSWARRASAGALEGWIGRRTRGHTADTRMAAPRCVFGGVPGAATAGRTLCRTADSDRATCGCGCAFSAHPATHTACCSGDTSASDPTRPRQQRQRMVPRTCWSKSVLCRRLVRRPTLDNVHRENSTSGWTWHWRHPTATSWRVIPDATRRAATTALTICRRARHRNRVAVFPVVASIPQATATATDLASVGLSATGWPCLVDHCRSAWVSSCSTSRLLVFVGSLAA